MTLFARLRKKPSFWVYVIVLLLQVIGLLWLSGLFLGWFPFSNEWEDLPPLPNGEVAVDFTDVLYRNRINVVTEQGHYYSCRYYQATPTCWQPIPREVHTMTLSAPPGTSLPWIPPGTRRAVSSVRPLGYYLDNHEYDALYAIIRADGRVAFLYTYENLFFNQICYSVIYLCCGVPLVIVGLLLLRLVLKTSRDLQTA